MKFYHSTSKSNARKIIKSGFKDMTGKYMTNCHHKGVWISDVLLDSNEGAIGEVILELNIPEQIVCPYEWVEDDKPYREFLVPADILNAYKIRIMKDDSVP